ncbi:hypothetical protein [Niallia sp. Man26]|uniref:hypothetical protein n=1 Tax=Niallia sp. Man26 TaxID=2912824 RepID=UPI001EDB81B8|nr:hypothetical protein [Niallia sp. Man26]UPO88336.1 hypothetical protein L8T27_003985 [Niallia sp. Man26]
MTLVELKDLLETTGYPVTYSHFTGDAPNPPYICFLEEDSNNFFADNKVYQEARNIRIELYTVKKDQAAEKKIKSILDEHEIAYQTDESYIDSEQLFMKIFELEMR